ncbi:MAG TPA: LEA type 2 family protein [Gemmatimonadaceae bacterium]|nr:LEA type 2 family protein [Gemmatimonadaceae bacterium]
MRGFTKFAIVIAAAASAGCATLGRQVFREPVVQLKDVRVNAAGLTGGTLDVVLSVYNPNNFQLDATRMTYRLLVDTVQFATGALDNRFVVPEDDSSTVTIPVNFTWTGVGELGRQLLNTGSVNYRVTGDVTVATPLGNFTRPYDRSGRYTALRGNTNRE